MSLVPIPDATSSVAFGINDYRKAVGYADFRDGTTKAFVALQTDAALIPALGAPGNSQPYNDARGINNRGQITGTSSTDLGPYHPYVYSAGGLRDLDPLETITSQGYGININGIVVGSSNTTHIATRFDTGGVPLGTLGGASSEAFAINDLGHAAGSAMRTDFLTHAALFAPTPQDLGTLGGIWSVAYGLNNKDQVVGVSGTAAGRNTAFLYMNNQMNAIESLLDPSLELSVGEARGINDFGQIAANASGDRALRLTPFKKYKQFDMPWGVRMINSQTTTPESMAAVGCTITTLTMVASLYGAEIDPGQMLDWIKTPKNNLLIAGTNSTNVTSFHYNQTNSLGLTTGFRTANRTFGWNEIIRQLEMGNPLMLAVPSFRRTTASTNAQLSNAEFHYVLAYGIRPNLDPSEEVTANDIFIADPGYRKTLYSEFPDYTPDEERTNITLDYYFKRVSELSKFGDKFSPVHWFEFGEYRDAADTTVLVSKENRNRMVTSFEGYRTLPAQPIPAGRPGIYVNSPVELVLKDPISGKRYVTDAAFAQNGDSILDKIGEDIIASIDEDAVSLAINDDESSLYPHYSLLLPPELTGVSLDVDIIGLDNGPYKIFYSPGSYDLIGSDALSGSIAPGEIVSGHFAVIAIPEPTGSIFGTIFAILAWSFRRPCFHG